MLKRVQKNIQLSGFAIVFLIAVSVSFFGLRTLQARENADVIANHTNEVISKINEVTLSLVNMETGLRGYLLTGNNLLLDHYYTGKEQYEIAILQLKDMTKTSPSQIDRWNQVDSLEQHWVNDWAAKGIQIRQDFDAGKLSTESLSSHMIAERDETVMDEIRTHLEAGKQEETNLLINQLKEGQRANYRAYYMMVAGFFISLILGLGTGWFLNRANIEKSKQIELHHLLIEEREKERMQLARNLHDGPIQDLLATMFSMQDLLMDDVAPGVIERLKAIKTSLQAIVSELRTNVTELRSPILSHYGLQKAIQADLENFQQKYPEIKVHYVGITKEVNLPESRLSALFKIYQEAMRNIIRHSAASEISIHYEVSGEALGLSIEDNGSGFMPPDDWLSLAQQGHFGLVGIRERIETIGGQVDIHSHPGKGTGIKITVPHCVNSEKSIEKIL